MSPLVLVAPEAATLPSPPRSLSATPLPLASTLAESLLIERPTLTPVAAAAKAGGAWELFFGCTMKQGRDNREHARVYLPARCEQYPAGSWSTRKQPKSDSTRRNSTPKTDRVDRHCWWKQRCAVV